MFGFSVFLNEDLTKDYEDYLFKMQQAGFQGIFTSIHIPEDDPKYYLSRLEHLGKIAKQFDLDLTIDVSANALDQIGVSYDNLSPLINIGVTAVRVDYGVSYHDIYTISRQMQIALNASTVTTEDVEQLDALSVDFSHLEAWHNYYPRPETGLDKRAFTKLNQWLRSLGIKVMAFVAGDGQKRGPLYEGLPSLEKHRNTHSLAASFELLEECAADKVYIGDPMISPYTHVQWEKYLQEKIIYFEADRFIQDQGQLNHIRGRHHQRPDVARDVVRSQEGRLTKSIDVMPLNPSSRKIGSVTIDNQNYERYEGEIQITKTELPQDDKVNVVGRIQGRDLALLNYIGPNQAFEINWKEGE